MEESKITVAVTHNAGVVALVITTNGGAVLNHLSRDQTFTFVCADTEDAVERLRAWIQSNVRATWDDGGHSDLWEVA